MKLEDLTGKDLVDAETYTHGYLPIAAAYCRSLNLVELINEMVPSEMELSPGLLVKTMVLDTLSGRSPIYRLREFVELQDSDLLLGENVDPRLFEDSNIGRALDQIFKAGSSNILTRLGTTAINKFKLDSSVVSYDTTSQNVWGDYDGADEPDAPNITYGYSKDHRPDLKQFMTELLCVERGIPIFGKTLDGNSSDKKSNNEILENISTLMTKNGLSEGSFIYVADSAMVSKNNLESVGKNKFITRLPATYKECGKAIQTAVEADQWSCFGTLAETPSSAKRPAAEYRGFDTTVNLYDRKYRAIVVHSSAHDKRRQKRIERELKKSNNDILQKTKTLNLIFACKEDAVFAANAAEKHNTKLHYLQTTVNEVQKRKRGRPSKTNPAPANLSYAISLEIKVKDEAVEKLKKEAGCFVLITNSEEADKLKLDALKILTTYKAQNGVERDFAFLKDPLIVNDLFLKKPSRIDVLGMVMIISLLIWRLMERSMRIHIKNTGEDLPGLNKQRTKRPTSFMLSVMITNIKTLVTKSCVRFLIKEPDDTTLAFLNALGLRRNVFEDPSAVCQPVIPRI
jgi:transposase